MAKRAGARVERFRPCNSGLGARGSPAFAPHHHLADAETVLYDRIRRILSEPRQVLWVFDQDAWATGLDYSSLPLDISRQIYESVRRGVIYYASLHYEQNGHLEFVHSVTGVRTLRDELGKVASHNEHHLGQIKAALSI
jgi:hypothetical protein